MKLKAELQPLAGKYYGSEIRLRDEEINHVREATIQVWINGISDYKPSERELRAHVEGLVRDGFTDTEIENDPDLQYEVSDDHYETQTAYLVCKKIVEALNDLEV